MHRSSAFAKLSKVKKTKTTNSKAYKIFSYDKHFIMTPIVYFPSILILSGVFLSISISIPITNSIANKYAKGLPPPAAFAIDNGKEMMIMIIAMILFFFVVIYYVFQDYRWDFLG